MQPFDDICSCLLCNWHLPCRPKCSSLRKLGQNVDRLSESTVKSAGAVITEISPLKNRLNRNYTARCLLNLARAAGRLVAVEARHPTILISAVVLHVLLTHKTTEILRLQQQTLQNHFEFWTFLKMASKCAICTGPDVSSFFELLELIIITATNQ